MDILLHLPEHIQTLSQTYGVWIYGLLFLIVFCETGLIILPFLPGDSLLFAVGALAGTGALDLPTALIIFGSAAIMGDTVNYCIGQHLQRRLFTENARFFKKTYLQKTEAFYEKNGAKMIVLARFIPIIRTFAPCVAGMSKMRYSTFLAYNIVGGVVWVSLFTIGGYFLGRVPLIQDNFGLLVIGIIVVSLLPLVSALKKERQA